MFCFTSGEARKSESVGRIVFVNLMCEYHCKNHKRVTAAFSSFSSHVRLAQASRACQIEQDAVYYMCTLPKPHPLIYVYKAFWQNSESPYSWNKTSNWYGLRISAHIQFYDMSCVHVYLFFSSSCFMSSVFCWISDKHFSLRLDWNKYDVHVSIFKWTQRSHNMAYIPLLVLVLNMRCCWPS